MEGYYEDGSSSKNKDLWVRVANEVLPVGKKLRAANLRLVVCKLCDKTIEMTLHATRECPKVHKLFQISGMDVFLPSDPFNSGLQWLEESRNVVDKKQFTFLIVLIWNGWNRRNKWVHEN
ncbi:hypothetical protein V6N12_069446 [Hibiscus sabdariffa]|uniref:Reverse transcriptase zinc-binding domain-containing protein n=1 Tax=Hibiscus sabdariffa TaxID=183260 RepID=A0ABR2FEB6_9ROSI